MSSSLLSLKLSSSPTPSPTPHISSSPSRFLPSSLSLPEKNNYTIRRLCFKARAFHLPDAKSNELSDTKPPNVSLSKGRTEILQEFGKNVQPQFMEFLVNKAPQQVVGAMRQTVTNMIGTLSPQFFAVPVTTVAENLAQLMSSVPMIGHMFRNAQFRLEPQNSMDQVALPGVQEKAVGAASVIWLSVLILIFVHPVISSQAFATVQAAATSGGSSGAAAVAVGGWLIRTEILSSAWTGFFAGCLHTLSGPDHLAALAPLSIGRTRLESAAVGALWGCGHDAGQLIFGCLFLLLKDRLHIEIIRTWGTRVVGLTLLVIGAMGIKEASEVPAPCVALEDGECDVSLLESLENRTPVKKKIGVATFATGIIHGLQPDALVMVLPALALPSRLAGAAFLGMFLLGTVFSMGSYTVFIGSCSQALKERIPRITEKLTWASSLVAIALGFAILISQLFGFSLY